MKYTDTSTYPLSNAVKFNWDIQAKFKEYSDTFTVELFNNWDNRPDCKIGHFGYNFYFRTPYGIKGKTYKNWGTLATAILKVAKHNGLTLEKIIIEGKSFSKLIIY